MTFIHSFYHNRPISQSYHSKCMAQTGRQHPNMSTTFIGRSRPLEDLCKQTPRSAEPVHKTEYKIRRIYYFKIKVAGVDKKILFLFNQSVFFFFLSLIKYGITGWYGNLTIQSKSKLAQLVQTALKVVGWEAKRPFQDIFEVAVVR